VEEHQRRTSSTRAAELLGDWDRALKTFRQIVPVAAVQAAAVPEPTQEETAEKQPKTAA
jgi:glutamate synthase domain-containing protein 3